MKKVSMLISIVVVLAFILSACGTGETPTPQVITVAETVEVEKITEKVVTEVVEDEKEVLVDG